MLPALEDLNINMLMNESVILPNSKQEPLYLMGIDDAQFFGVDNIEKAMTDIPLDACIPRSFGNGAWR